MLQGLEELSQAAALPGNMAALMKQMKEEMAAQMKAEMAAQMREEMAAQMAINQVHAPHALCCGLALLSTELSRRLLCACAAPVAAAS